MLGDSEIVAVVPTHDIDTSRRFYEDTLGLKVRETNAEMGSVVFEGGGGAKLLLYQTQVAIPAEHTVCDFVVRDVDATVADLESRGVTFEEYDLADFGFPEAGKGKVVEMQGLKAAWFKDPEGNILAIGDQT